MGQIPKQHRIPFWYSWNGFRGSHFLWGFISIAKQAPNLSEVQLPNGFPMIVNDEDWISKTIYQGTYERSLLRFLDSLILSSLVVDVGANIGVTLWHALRNSEPDTTYIAFEPSKQCLQGLKITTSRLSRNGYVLEFAVGDSNGTQALHGIENEMHSGGASLISHSGLRGHSEDVEVRKLDTVLDEYLNGTPVSLLKIDTEGYEGYVIAGGSKLLESGLVEIIVMEVSPNFGEVSYLNNLKDLLGEQYTWFTLEESGKFKRKPTLYRITLQQSLARTTQWNLILIRHDVFEFYCGQNHQTFLGYRIFNE
jgi:FkbM family methyltransferase